MSARDPVTYTLREFGSGLTAASSTCAVAFRNLGFAFMLRSLLTTVARERAEGEPTTLPYDGIIRIRFKGCFSPQRQFQVSGLRVQGKIDPCTLHLAPWSCFRGPPTCAAYANRI